VKDYVEGWRGRAWRIPIPPDANNASIAVCYWLISAPSYHPLWGQYDLCVFSLADTEGIEPAHLDFDGATHELMLRALNPETGHGEGGKYPQPHTPECISSHFAPGSTGGIRFLTPVNIALQFEASGDEMDQLAEMAVEAVCNGLWNPETSDAPETIRGQWKSGMVRTLAHIRGEAHSPGEGHPIVGG
jgi:hypothetical protein